LGQKKVSAFFEQQSVGLKGVKVEHIFLDYDRKLVHKSVVFIFQLFLDASNIVENAENIVFKLNLVGVFKQVEYGPDQFNQTSFVLLKKYRVVTHLFQYVQTLNQGLASYHLVVISCQILALFVLHYQPIEHPLDHFLQKRQGKASSLLRSNPPQSRKRSTHFPQTHLLHQHRPYLPTKSQLDAVAEEEKGRLSNGIFLRKEIGC